MERLQAKRKSLNAFLWFVIDEVTKQKNIVEIITPRNKDEHGCQISLLTGDNGKQIFDELTKQGVIADWREPNVIRIAAVPLYNSFEDVWKFGDILHKLAN